MNFIPIDILYPPLGPKIRVHSYIPSMTTCTWIPRGLSEYSNTWNIKLNYFLFCQNFEKKIYFITLCWIFVIIIKLRIWKFSTFDCWGLNRP
jgi:hypothetical protein